MKKYLSITAMLIFLSGTSAYGAHPLITDDAGTMGKGNAQLEINGEYAHNEEAGVTEECSDLTPTLTYGITDSVDMVVSVPYQALKVKEAGTSVSESGLADLAVELKWNFYNRGNIGLALKPGLTLPTGNEDKGLGVGKAGYGAFLIGSLDQSPFMVHTNIGYFRNENKCGERNNIWHGSLATEYAINDALTAVVDIGLEINPDPQTDIPPAFLLGGLIYSVTDKIDIDGGVKIGLNKYVPDYSFLAGMTLAF